MRSRRKRRALRRRIASVAVRFVAIIAAAVFVVGLLNRPDGDWAPAVDITPHSVSCSGGDCASGR
jgi:hypothetical protein